MRKNQYFIVLLALCICTCGVLSCSPCKKKSYKEISDNLVTGVAALGNGKYAVYIDFEAYFAASGKNTDFKWRSWWPGAWLGEDAFIPAEKDDCGMYVILENKENQLRLDIRQSKNTFVDNFSDAFSAYKCAGDTIGLCFNPADL
jgi:hypothetical protein